MSHTQESWRERFDEEFLTEADDLTHSGLRLICDPNFAKAFIETEILKAKGEGRVQVINHIISLLAFPLLDKDMRSALQAILSEIEARSPLGKGENKGQDIKS